MGPDLELQGQKENGLGVSIEDSLRLGLLLPRNKVNLFCRGIPVFVGMILNHRPVPGLAFPRCFRREGFMFANGLSAV